MDVNKKDFTGMEWRIDELPDNEKCVDAFPELKNIFLEFLNYKTESLTNDQIIRMIVYCYHRKSPFVEKMDNIIERKTAVFNYLKVKDNKGIYPKDIQAIIKSSDAKTAKLIYQFCKFENSLTYFALVTTTEAYIKMNEKLGDDMEGSKESKDTVDIMIKLQKVEERIDYLADKLFKRDKDLKDFVGSVLIIEGRKKKLWVEDWAD